MRFIIFFMMAYSFLYALEIEKIFIPAIKDVEIPPMKKSVIKDFGYSKKLLSHKSFYIAKYEITKQQAAKALHLNLSLEDEANEPYVNVTFFKAQEICHYYHGRLPTQEEWIIAASVKVAPSQCYESLQKGKFYSYPTGTFPISQQSSIFHCLAQEDDELEASLIGSELLEVEDSYENLNGVYGMLGNVWEWVDTKKELFFNQYYLIKGGSYANANEVELFDVRIENPLKPTMQKENVGFRCVWDKQ